jgi:membrane protein DedA with SNARE-associated domain
MFDRHGLLALLAAVFWHYPNLLPTMAGTAVLIVASSSFNWLSALLWVTVVTSLGYAT